MERKSKSCIFWYLCVHCGEYVHIMTSFSLLACLTADSHSKNQQCLLSCWCTVTQWYEDSLPHCYASWPASLLQLKIDPTELSCTQTKWIKMTKLELKCWFLIMLMQTAHHFFDKTTKNKVFTNITYSLLKSWYDLSSMIDSTLCTSLFFVFQSLWASSCDKSILVHWASRDLN